MLYTQYVILIKEHSLLNFLYFLSFIVSKLRSTVIPTDPVPPAAADPKRPQQHARNGANADEDRRHKLDRGSPPWPKEPALLR